MLMEEPRGSEPAATTSFDLHRKRVACRALGRQTLVGGNPWTGYGLFRTSSNRFLALPNSGLILSAASNSFSASA
jgi:hypothetical protein